jgi:hypothetical protein
LELTVRVGKAAKLTAVVFVSVHKPLLPVTVYITATVGHTAVALPEIVPGFQT